MDYLKINMATKSPEECEDIFDGFQDYMDKLIHRALPVTNADFDPENPQEGFNKVKDIYWRPNGYCHQSSC